MILKSKSCPIFLGICTPVNLKALSMNLTLIFYDFISKTSPDLIASLYSRDLEGVECRSDVDVSFDILFKTFNLGKLVLKVKSLVITNMIFDLKMF